MWWLILILGVSSDSLNYFNSNVQFSAPKDKYNIYVYIWINKADVIQIVYHTNFFKKNSHLF